MAKNMDKQLSLGLEPSRNPVEQLTIIPHVLDHLHREYAVELLIGLKLSHVPSEHGHISKIPLLELVLDELPLRIRIRDRSNLAVWVVLCQPQR